MLSLALGETQWVTQENSVLLENLNYSLSIYHLDRRTRNLNHSILLSLEETQSSYRQRRMQD